MRRPCYRPASAVLGASVLGGFGVFVGVWVRGVSGFRGLRGFKRI